MTIPNYLTKHPGCVVKSSSDEDVMTSAPVLGQGEIRYLFDSGWDHQSRFFDYRLLRLSISMDFRGEDPMEQAEEFLRTHPEDVLRIIRSDLCEAVDRAVGLDSPDRPTRILVFWEGTLVHNYSLT